MDWVVPTILTVISASTPLLLAALGELVTEKSGVLNLGVEGMMLAGAIAGFAVAIGTGSWVLAILAAALAGAALALIFAILTLTLLANQVATGLALTIFGIGISALAGAEFVGTPYDGLPRLEIPGLSHLPVVGPLLFGHDFLIYLSFFMVFAVAWFLTRTKAGLVLRAVGENHEAAHSIGYHVVRIRYLAVLFGGVRKEGATVVVFALTDFLCGGGLALMWVRFSDRREALRLMKAGVAARGVFIIDDRGVLQSQTVNNLGIGRSIDEILRVIQAAQWVAEHGEVCPANWKPGEATMKPDPEGSREHFARVK